MAKDKKNDIKISASSKEEWDMIKEKLDLLPDVVLDQIESADSSFSVKCHMKHMFGENPRLYIPKQLVTQIKEFHDYIGIYCGDYFFEAPKVKSGYEYIFVDMNTQAKE